MRIKNILILLFLIFPHYLKLEAQGFPQADTLVLSLPEAERLFLSRNFELLAAKYQISEADAAIIQAKLWDNPNLNLEQGVYNPDTRKWFDVTHTGESAVIIQQLISLGGKRIKRVGLEKINAQVARYQFYDLIRVLRYELRTSFFELFFLEKSVAVYDKELAAAKKLVDSYLSEYQGGNVSFNEFARLQALQFNLENEKIDLLKNVNEKQYTVALITGDTLSRPVKPFLDVSAYEKINMDSLRLGQLLAAGMVNRDDLKIAEAQVQYEQANLSLEKAMRIPDITIGGRWDRQGSYVYNYNSLSVGFDLPFWNRNQGNIKIAQNKIEENKALSINNKLQINNDIRKAFTELIETDRLYKSSLQNFNDKYYNLLEGITVAYQNHTISLLEFIDYIETYKNSITEFNNLRNNRLKSIEDLNLATGTMIIK